MSSDILNGAAMQPIPNAAGIHIETVGTSSTDEVDLFEELGVSSNQSRVRVTVEGDGVFYIVGGDTGLAAAAVATSKRIPADSPRFFFVKRERRFVRIIAAEASTRVEFTLG